MVDGDDGSRGVRRETPRVPVRVADVSRGWVVDDYVRAVADWECGGFDGEVWAGEVVGGGREVYGQSSLGGAADHIGSGETECGEEVRLVVVEANRVWCCAFG